MTPPSIDQWQVLYQQAIQLKKMAPWNWMEEIDLFGVQDPADGSLDFVSVMGMAGEHFAIAVYRGAQAVHDLLQLHENPSDDPRESGERIMEIPQLQLSFEDRDFLEDEDLQLIKELGLHFRGARAWPQFRAYRPGCFPWWIDRDDARILERALDQLLDVAPRFERNYELLHPDLGRTFLVRVAAGDSWRDRYLPLPPSERRDAGAPLDAFTLSRFEKLMPTARDLAVDFFRLWSPVADGDDCPYYPYILLLVDAVSGEIVGVDILTPKPSLAEMRRSVPLRFLELCEQTGGLPRQVKVRDPRLFAIVQVAIEVLPIALELLPKLPMLDRLRDHLIESAREGFDPSLMSVNFDAGLDPAEDEDSAFAEVPIPPFLFSLFGGGDEDFLEDDDGNTQLLTPLDELGIALHTIGANAVPAPLQIDYEAFLTAQTIDFDHPSSVLRDFNRLLDAIGADGIEMTKTNKTPRARFMTELNEQLTHPIALSLKRAQPKSYPNVNGLYLLLRAAGLGRIERDKYLRLDPSALENWFELNPSEQYFTLLESWLQRVDMGVIGEFTSPYHRPLQQWLSFYTSIPQEGLSMLGGARWEDHVHSLPDLPMLSLMEMFGLIAITQGQPGPNEGWCVERIERTPFGDALLARLFFYLSNEWEKPLQPDNPFFGHLVPVYRPFFPAWQAYLQLPEVESTEALHVFTVSLARNVWRRIAAPDATSLDLLAHAILDAFEFDLDHLYAFYCENRFGTMQQINHPHLDRPPYTHRTCVGDLKMQVGDDMTFLFDFGDQWEFRVHLDRLDPPDRRRKKPQLLEKRGKAPEQYPDWGGL